MVRRRKNSTGSWTASESRLFSLRQKKTHSHARTHARSTKLEPKISYHIQSHTYILYVHHEHMAHGTFFNLIFLSLVILMMLHSSIHSVDRSFVSLLYSQFSFPTLLCCLRGCVCEYWVGDTMHWRASWFKASGYWRTIYSTYNIYLVKMRKIRLQFFFRFTWHCLQSTYISICLFVVCLFTL